MPVFLCHGCAVSHGTRLAQPVFPPQSIGPCSAGSAGPRALYGGNIGYGHGTTPESHPLHLMIMCTHISRACSGSAPSGQSCLLPDLTDSPLPHITQCHCASVHLPFLGALSLGICGDGQVLPRERRCSFPVRLPRWHACRVWPPLAPFCHQKPAPAKESRENAVAIIG